MTFGEKIQQLRKEQNLSQEDLAEQLGVSRQAVSKWERDAGYPETEKLIRMSRLFHVTMDDLVNDGGSQENRPAEQLLAQTYITPEKGKEAFAWYCNRTRKTALGVGVIVAGMAFGFCSSDLGPVLWIAAVIAGAAVLLSGKLAQSERPDLGRGPLVLEPAWKRQLERERNSRKSRLQWMILLGFLLTAVGILLLPMLEMPSSLWQAEDLVMAAGFLLAGLGTFLWIYGIGVLRAYERLLGQTKGRQ